MASRVTFTAGLTTLALAALTTVAPGTAHATASATCGTSGTTMFDTGVQAVTQTHSVAYRGRPSGCVDNSRMGIRSARLDLRFDRMKLSCTGDDIGADDGTATIVWTVADGGTARSELDITITETYINTALVGGVVTSGPFTGQRFSATVTVDLLGDTGRCAPGTKRRGAAGGGIKSVSFQGTFGVG